MRNRLTALRSIFITSQEVSRDLANLQSARWYSTALNRSDSREASARLYDRGSTKEVYLYAIAASSVGIVMGGMTILWLVRLGEIVLN